MCITILPRINFIKFPYCDCASINNHGTTTHDQTKGWCFSMLKHLVVWTMTAWHNSSKIKTKVWYRWLLAEFYSRISEGETEMRLHWWLPLMYVEYLRGRHQCVSIDGSLSCMSPVISGVPQGSILGPLLFVLFINDIVDAIDANTMILL